MNENNGVMICPKCGNEMRAKDRFCFHCGYINYDNDNNQFLEKYDKKAQRILKKEKKKEPERSKFFNSNVKVNNTNNDSSGKKFYRSVEEYREDVNRNVTK